MRSDVAMELDEVAAFLAHQYGDRARRVQVLAAGDWSRAYAFDLDGQPVVGRFGAHVTDFAKDRVMGEASAPSLAIPRVIDMGAASRGYFVIAERAGGITLDVLDERAMRATLPSLLSTLDAIRDLEVSDSSGFGYWAADEPGRHPSWRDALLDIAREQQRVPGWRAALASSPVGMAPFDVGFERLADLSASLPAARHLVHSDLLNRNVLVERDHVSAVLDWGNALYGDHLYDAAWLVYWWPWYPAWRSIDIRAELEAHWLNVDGRLPVDADRRLQAYQLHIGLDSMAYCSFRNRWEDVADSARRVLQLTEE